MKKLVFITLIISLILALSACGSTPSATAAATTSTTLSMEGQLLVGSFKLENTALAITSAQATSLLPLWETLQSLASSNTTASQEVDAVVSQIQSTLSTHQVASITAMKLTQSDLAAAAVDTGTASSTASSTTTAKTSSSQPQAGGPVGNPPSDIGAISGVPSTGQTQTGTTQAAATQSTLTTSQVSASMIKALVEMLQKKIA
jgi:peptidoglycan DL-endopeptidase CwlO